ncbi:MAG: hypothetical protein HQ518_19265 [Rhodopirellula sp.]|nr:hypothetical protein [Rhodopirellula sp.]
MTATLLDAGAVLTVRDGKLVIHVDSALPDELLSALRRDRSEIIERWLERAAIREFDGGYQRSEAESLASKDLLCLDSDWRS